MFPGMNYSNQKTPPPPRHIAMMFRLSSSYLFSFHLFYSVLVLLRTPLKAMVSSNFPVILLVYIFFQWHPIHRCSQIIFLTPPHLHLIFFSFKKQNLWKKVKRKILMFEMAVNTFIKKQTLPIWFVTVLFQIPINIIKFIFRNYTRILFSESQCAAVVKRYIPCLDSHPNGV